MRDITERNYKATVLDGDEKHVFFYRRPDNKEIAAYQSSLFERKGNKLIPKAAEARTKFGARILIGFEKGSLGINGKAISSDPNDEDFRGDWKELLVKYLPDVVAAVGRHAFEGTGVISDTPNFEIGEEELDEDELPDPLKQPKSSS